MVIRRKNQTSRRPLLAALVVGGLVLAACGGDDDASPATTEAAPTTAAATEEDTPAEDDAPDAAGDAPKLAIVYSAEWFDGSWGEFAYLGAQQLLEEGVVSEISLQENVQPGADVQNAMRDLADDGFNPIIAHSFNFGDDVKIVAADYPEVIFVYAGGFGDVEGNVGDYSQPFYEPAYLQGILAAGAVEGSIAGAGGFDIPVCRAMKNAFLAGAQELDPDATGTFVAVGDWYDVQLAKEAALAQADGGATRFIGCGQGPTFGQIEAADEIGGVSMGYVGDMSDLGESVLASFTWNLSEVFRLIVGDVAAGLTEARYYEAMMVDGGTQVVISPAWIDRIDPAALELYEQRLAEILDGTFVVPFDDVS